MASSAQEMVDVLREMQSMYRNTHHPNITELRDTVTRQVNHVVAEGGTWAVHEMRVLDEEWQQNQQLLSQVAQHFLDTATKFEPIIELLLELAAAG